MAYQKKTILSIASLGSTENPNSFFIRYEIMFGRSTYMFQKMRVFVCFFVVVFLLTGCFFTKSKIEQIPANIKQICFDASCFNIEIADTSEKRQRGLMFRESLPEGGGMLFVYAKPLVARFRMKNTLIPLDMIWLNESGVVIDIVTGIPPCTADPCPSYGPADKESSYVLEIGSGEAEKAGVTIGKTGKIVY